MFSSALNAIGDLMTRGGYVMYPLAACSVVALTLIFERCVFWLRANNAVSRHCYQRLGRALRDGDLPQAQQIIRTERNMYTELVRQLLEEGATDAAASDAIENQRPRVERFMTTLSTLITAAPMLGILGTVTGIISAFQSLNTMLATSAARDPSQVAGGIAEALLTTVAGLVIALVVLFPYNAFRVQIDRTLARMENLIAAAQSAKK